jgi:hypothetical protein
MILSSFFILTLLGYFLCWLYEPTSRLDGFLRGLSVITILSVVTPFQAYPAMAMIEPLSTSYIPVSEARSELAMAKASVYLKFADTNDDIHSGLATLMRQSSAEIVAREQIRTSRIDIDQPDGRYILEIEADGYRITRAPISLDVDTRYYELTIQRSDIPVRLQRLLYRPDEVPLVEVGAAPTS